MTGQRVDAGIEPTGTGIRRRGILTAAGAVVAGIVAKQASQPVAAAGLTLEAGNTVNTTETTIQVAAAYADTGVLTVDASTSTTTATTGITALTATGKYRGAGLVARGGSAAALGANPPSVSAGNAIFATGGTGGTFAGATYGGGIGVASAGGQGGATGGDGGIGVAAIGGIAAASGKAGGIGLRAQAGVGNAPTSGVFATNSNAGVGNTGVTGNATGAGAIGVLGQSDASSSSIGVSGASNLGFGVYGTSNGGPGIFGTTTATQNAGLAGLVSTPGTAAFAGTATVPTAFAGFFTGDVFVNGNFTVNDPTKKHGAIQHPDGSLRLLYSMESPESWLEDFGTGQLVGGHAEVRLDADFAAVVQTEEYHVFLTLRDAGCKGLAVVAQTASGFVVQEVQGGTSGGGFSYRVVAKPKTTNKAVRLAKFTVPDIQVPQPPPMPSVPVGKMQDVPPQAAPPSRPSSPAIAPPQGNGATQGGTTNPVQPAPPPRP